MPGSGSPPFFIFESFFPHAHTGGDTVVFLDAWKVVDMGDMLSDSADPTRTGDRSPRPMIEKNKFALS
jgi:hypothetical protein